MTMVFAPKLATIIDALSRQAGRQRFGGGVRLMIGSLSEVIFSTLMAPIMAIAHSLFLLGLTLGRAVVWGPQRRLTHGVRYPKRCGGCGRRPCLGRSGLVGLRSSPRLARW